MAEKVPIEIKLKFLENRIQKSCQYHKRQASLFCLKLDCDLCPYLCNACLRENTHGHQNSEVFEFYEFAKRLCMGIEQQKRKGNQILDFEEKDYEWVIKQQLKALEKIQLLQKQVNDIFEESKANIQSALNTNLNRDQQRSDQMFKLYSNPNLLINKIGSDPAFGFLLELKRLMLPKENGQNGEKAASFQIHNQLLQIQVKIKDLVNFSNGIALRPKPQKNPNISNDLRANFSKTISLQDYPMNIYSTFQNVLVPIGAQTYSYNLLQKYKSQMLSVTLKNVVKSNLINDTSFIGLSGPSSLVVTGKHSKISKMTLAVRVTALGYLATYSKSYALLGQEDGTLDMLDIEANQIVFHHKIQESAIVGIQVFSRNALIVCLYENSTVHIYRYQHEYQSFVFEYLRKISFSAPFNDVYLIKIYQQELYLFGSCRNLLVFDLLLNCEKLRTNFTQKAPPFTHAGFIETGNAYQSIILTLSRGESVVYSWVFDRSKASIKVDPLLLNGYNREPRELRGIEILSDNLWTVQESDKNIIIYSLEM